MLIVIRLFLASCSKIYKLIQHNANNINNADVTINVRREKNGDTPYAVVAQTRLTFYAINQRAPMTSSKPCPSALLATDKITEYLAPLNKEDV